jgi:adenine phosphoribosyltransferase
MDLKPFIRDIPDFPKPGILFKDITPLLKDPGAFRESIDQLARSVEGLGITDVVGIEARGFVFGAALALQIGSGFVPVRKPRKLPSETISECYSLEYGTDTIEMHSDALSSGSRAAIVDDLLATGGTMRAAVRLVEQTGAKVACIRFVVELSFLNGREKLLPVRVECCITY